MAGILDFLNGQGGGGGLLDFLRGNALNQQMPGGLLSDTADYGQAPQPGMAPPMSMAGPNQPNQPQAQFVPATDQMNPKPSPLDNAPWPAGHVGSPYGPVGSPSNANAAMPQPQAAPKAGPMSFAPAQPPAPAAPASAGPGFGDRFGAALQTFAHGGGLLPAISAGFTGQREDAAGIEAQKEAKLQTATAQALISKGASPADVAAATGNPALMTALIQKHYGPGDRDFAFRQEEAKRAQTNADRSYTLAERAATRADEGPVEVSTQRAQAAAQFGLVPGSPEHKAYVLTGKLPEGNTTVAAQTDQRKQAAASIGLMPDHPAYQAFILTGKMPREDAQPLTATDKKAILEADEKVQSGRSTIDNLNKAKVLSKQAFAGPYAGKLGLAASFMGETSDTGKAGIATQDLENLVTSNALQQLKTIFGGNPTEGERGILLDIQGSVSKPDAVRQKIFDRAIEAAKKRLAFEQQRADELRGGTFYKTPGGKASAAAAAPAPVASEPAATADKAAIEAEMKRRGLL